MRDVYVLNDDQTISAVNAEKAGNRPWFVSVLAAAVHGGVQMTCFTKDGVRAEEFINPQPDLSDISEGEEQRTLNKSHFFVLMAGNGEIFTPPLFPEEAASYYRALEEQKQIDEKSASFSYDAPGTVPYVGSF